MQHILERFSHQQVKAVLVFLRNDILLDIHSQTIDHTEVVRMNQNATRTRSSTTVSDSTLSVDFGFASLPANSII